MAFGKILWLGTTPGQGAQFKCAHEKDLAASILATLATARPQREIAPEDIDCLDTLLRSTPNLHPLLPRNGHKAFVAERITWRDGHRVSGGQSALQALQQQEAQLEYIPEQIDLL